MVCVRVPDAVTGAPAELIASYGTTTPELVDWLRGLGVTHVAMEPAGVYWKPICYLLENDFTVLLVNGTLIRVGWSLSLTGWSWSAVHPVMLVFRLGWLPASVLSCGCTAHAPTGIRPLRWRRTSLW